MMNKDKKAGTILIIPSFLLFTCFLVIPLILSVIYSCTKWNGINNPIFIGIKNYLYLFENKDFWKCLTNTLILLLASLVFQVYLALIFAWLIFNTGKTVHQIVKFIIFIPVVVAPMAIGLLFSLFYNPEFGLINYILQFFSPNYKQINWLSDSSVVLFSVMLPQIWQYIGLYTVIFLAALIDIPKEIFESSTIDGANRFQIFFHIITPILKDITTVCFILAITGSLKAFDHAWAITGGGPGFDSSYLAILMYKISFIRGQFGLGTTVSVIQLFVAFSLTIITRKIMKNKEDK